MIKLNLNNKLEQENYFNLIKSNFSLKKEK